MIFPYLMKIFREIIIHHLKQNFTKVDENPEFSALDPELLEEGEEERVKVTDYGRVVVPNKEELKEKTRGLDKDQRKVLDITLKFARDVHKARLRGRAPPEPPHLMVHGTAGTGSQKFQNISYDLLVRYFTMISPCRQVHCH